MKTLKFAPHLVDLILKGEKASTWRLFDDKDITIGDDFEFINRETGKVFGQAKIVSVRIKALGIVNDADYENGHERYESPAAMLKNFQGYYGDSVSFDTPVKIVKFSFAPTKERGV